MGKTILVIGSGGREHTLAWKLLQSSQVDKVFVAPGNAGTHACDKVSNTDINIKDDSELITFCKKEDVSLVVVGPEDPLANGIADVLTEAGIPCFGPSAKASEIEASKDFAKGFMKRHNIPTADWKAFTSMDEACTYIKKSDGSALVVKASGLAAGKGVVVANSLEEACYAVKDMLEGNKFGKAGATIVVEEKLEGEEVSVLAFSDGSHVVCMPPAQDHKRLLDGDKGLNTGGMGAYCPCPFLNKEQEEFVRKEIIQKSVDAMKSEGFPYVGVLYAGLMVTEDGPKVLEFNCRFGDPETQVILPLLKTDLYTVLSKCVEGALSSITIEFETLKSAVGVVAASGGYPGSYKKGVEITGIEKVSKEFKQTVFHAGTKLSDNKIVTSGGRVLAVVAVDDNLETAAWKAQLGMAVIKFEDKVYRKDIANKALKGAKLTYSDSGVNIGAGDTLVDNIKPYARATSRRGCSSDLGMFGGVFDLKETGYQDPMLVSGTDGVGTKLKIAQDCKQHNTVGIDLVAMCVNDVLCHGAEPFFFLDYFACGKLDVGTASTVIEGIADGCCMANCALLGGETAEMPGMYGNGEYDLAGFVVGAVERDKYLPRMSDIKPGDVVIGIGSSGVHSNGFSMVRKLVEYCNFTYDMSSPFDTTKKLGKSLLVPTKIYVNCMKEPLSSGKVKAIAHVTGGGIPGNLVRVLPKGVGLKLDAKKWDVLPVFGWIAAKGNVESAEMARTFNCGIGLALIVSKDDETSVLEMIKGCGEKAWTIGSACIEPLGQDRVQILHLEEALEHSFTHGGKHRAEPNTMNGCDKRKRTNGLEPVQKKKVGVLISGTGTNLQALIDHTRNPNNDSAAEISLVISNKERVKGLKRAEAAGIATKVINHKEYKSREEFDDAIHEALIDASIEIVCLAGFMRILSGKFVRQWNGKMLNVHPSLLPSFKGSNAHEQVLASGVKLSGCSVHFVAEEVDAGAILVQHSVPVLASDTLDTLQERVKTTEHKAFPEALELVASGRAKLGNNNKVVWNA